MPNPKVLFKFGTRAQYEALATTLDNALYFLTDTGELYRGSVPFGQAHVYDTNRQTDKQNAALIVRVLNGAIPAYNDLIIARNANQTVDILMYTTMGWTQLNSNVAASEIVQTAQRVTTLEGQVADLEAILNGTPADPEQGTEAVPGLTDRVTTLESQIAGVSGAFHFKGTTADLSLISNPAEGDVYQVGEDEYAWNGTAWVKLGGNFDTSALATKRELSDAVADLEALIGHPATTETVHNDETGEDEEVPVAATGIYADLANNPGTIIPIFDGTVNGLVPVLDATVSAEDKANYYLNALGQWARVAAAEAGTITVDGTTYTVQEYVDHMVEQVQLEWEPIAE